MDAAVKKEMEDDIALARSMTDLNNPKDVLELVNHMVGYMDLVSQAITDYRYKADQLEGKRKVLMEFIRSGKNYAQTLSINESLVRKGL